MKSFKDEYLIELYQGGSLSAFEEIYGRYEKRIEYFFFRMLWNDREKASDFTQDLFLKVIEKINSFNTGLSFKTWIFSIANNMCKNEYRKSEVESRVYENLKAESVTHHQNGAEKATDFEVFMKELQFLLNQEDEQKKTAFMLRYFEEMPIKEIAEVLHLPEGTVKSGLHYTTKRLSKKLIHFKPI